MLAALLTLLVAAPTPAELLESKDVKERLKAVSVLHEKGGEGAEALLLSALQDNDWEVVHRAADALGKRGGPDSVSALVDLSIKGPVRRIRLAAAQSLKQVGAEQGAELIANRMKGPSLFPAAEALAVLGHTGGSKLLVRMLKQKDVARRVAAVRALGAERNPEHIEIWRKLLKGDTILVQAAVLDVLVLAGRRGGLSLMRDGLKARDLSQVMERRYRSAIRELLLVLADPVRRAASAKTFAQTFGMTGSGEADARFARLLGSLGRREKPVGPVEEYTKTLLSTGLNNGDLRVRRASIAALARIGHDPAYERISALAKDDAEWKVRFHAMRACVKLRGANALTLVLDRLHYDKHKFVREEAATICARLKRPEAGRTLIAALKDTDWGVAVCAAVSLGRLHLADAVDPLIALAKAKDWRRRGGAAAGLGRLRSKKAVSVLIDLLRDKEPAVVATAREFLRHIANKKLRNKEFREWWAKAEHNFEFRDPDKEAREAKKYGYALTRRGVYEDFDLVVLVTRRGGDNIQVLLKDYGIEHREVRAASVHKCGIQPYSLFVANCPGEIVDKDAERLQWFVRAGGYLFASCWALTHTVARCFPEVVDKLPLKGQVIGTVGAEGRKPNSPYMKGVFDSATSPLYQLMGSHLIRVLDPERFEVLIDSPEAASTWGDGNLAGWFTVGHGTILDSANHFDLQGSMKAAKLRTEKDRMAFAMDHLGYDYKEIRKLKEEGVFRKGPVAEKNTRDLSTFKFITTFVREKRLADEE